MFASRFCIGCPDVVFNMVRREEIGDVVIVDCDKNYIESTFNDIPDMPHEIVKKLEEATDESVGGSAWKSHPQDISQLSCADHRRVSRCHQVH